MLKMLPAQKLQLTKFVSHVHALELVRRKIFSGQKRILRRIIIADVKELLLNEIKMLFEITTIVRMIIIVIAGKRPIMKVVRQHLWVVLRTMHYVLQHLFVVHLRKKCVRVQLVSHLQHLKHLKMKVRSIPVKKPSRLPCILMQKLPTCKKQDHLCPYLTNTRLTPMLHLMNYNELYHQTLIAHLRHSIQTKITKNIIKKS
mmetsp:Transcript_19577/g.27692  ORF Transcript_19577/g.27692 Transcript_19577/m.27692 type:complete len:201 (-) Transcript_19577:502-1104(-)